MADWSIQAYKHVFTSPSSIDVVKPKAMHSCNVSLHRMSIVTKASIAYVAMQVSAYCGVVVHY